MFGFTREASEAWLWNMDRVQMFYETLYFIVAAGVLWGSYRKSNTPLQQQQYEVDLPGDRPGDYPYTLFFVIPYLLGTMTNAGHHHGHEDFRCSRWRFCRSRLATPLCATA